MEKARISLRYVTEKIGMDRSPGCQLSAKSRYVLVWRSRPSGLSTSVGTSTDSFQPLFHVLAKAVWVSNGTDHC